MHFKNKFTQYHTLFEIQMKFNNKKKYIYICVVVIILSIQNEGAK